MPSEKMPNPVIAMDTAKTRFLNANAIRKVSPPTRKQSVNENDRPMQNEPAPGNCNTEVIVHQNWQPKPRIP